MKRKERYSYLNMEGSEENEKKHIKRTEYQLQKKHLGELDETMNPFFGIFCLDENNHFTFLPKIFSQKWKVVSPFVFFVVVGCGWLLFQTKTTTP